MAMNGVFFGWNRPAIGREKEAAEVFTSSMTFWTKKQQAGEIDSFEPVLLGRHGGDLNGFVIVRGAQNKLRKILDSEEFIELSLRIDHATIGFGSIPAWIGDGVNEQMTRWMKLIAE